MTIKRLKMFVLVAMAMLLVGIGVKSALALPIRGALQVGVSESAVTLAAGQTSTVTATTDPAQQMETIGCGAASCPQGCGPGCAPDGYDCTCDGTAMYPYYPTMTAVSDNTKVATVSVTNTNGLQVIIQGVAAGTATITVTANLRQYNSAEQQIPVTVTGTGSAPVQQTGGIISTVAGDGTEGYTGDGGPALQAKLWSPQGVAVDRAGDIFIADFGNNQVREVAAVSGAQYGISMTAGDIYTVAGHGMGSSAQGYSGDGGPAVAADLDKPADVAVDRAGDIFIADLGNGVIREVAAVSGAQYGISMTAGDIYTVGSGGGSVAVDTSGNLYWGSDEYNELAAVTHTQFGISMTAGQTYTAIGSNSGDTTPPNTGAVAGLAVDTSGNLYFAETGGMVIREVAATTHTQYGISMTAGYAYTVAGTYDQYHVGGESGDGGPAIWAELSDPEGVAVDTSGNLYIPEEANNDISGDGSRIREVDAGGTITTVAGDGTGGYTGDGGPAVEAEIGITDVSGYYSNDVAVDASGNLYFIDGDVIRMVTPLNSAVSLTGATFDRNVSDSVYHTDIPVTVTLNGNTLTGISNGGYTLASGTDYTVSGAVYTINTSYLDTLSTGTADLTFNFSAGQSQTLTVTVEDSLTSTGGLTITPASGTYTAPLTVTVSDGSLSVGQSVYYSTAGDPQAASGYTYANPLPYSFTLSGPATVYAQVYGSGTWGNPVTAAYTIGSATSATSTIDPATGGTVALGTGATLDIPAGALQGTSGATVTVQQSNSPPAVSSGFTLLGSVYEFTVNGADSYSFSKPATITFTFDQSAVPSGGTPAVYYYDTASSQWVDVGGTVSGDTITVTVDHFTQYAVMAEAETVSSGGGGGGTVSYKPSVSTGAATSITADSAVLTGDITSDSGYDVTGYGFLWGASATSLTNKLAAGADNHSGTFTASLDSLAAGATYYFEAYATNSQGTADGSPLSFTTTGTAATTTPPATTTATTTFSDVPSSYWGYTAISSLSAKGIVAGYPDGSFKPGASITRAEFAAMLAKALNLDTAGTGGSFTDVKADGWYYGSVNAAASAGLVSGTGDHLFSPNALITREQMAVMVAKALGDKAPSVSGAELDAFSDHAAVGSWAASGMEQAVKAGIVSGMTTDTLAPEASATRAEAAAMIYKLLGVLGK